LTCRRLPRPTGAGGRYRRAPLVRRARTKKRVKRPRATPFCESPIRSRPRGSAAASSTATRDGRSSAKRTGGLWAFGRSRSTEMDRIVVNSGLSHLTVGEVLIPSPRDPQAPTRAPSGLTAHPDPPHRNTESPHPRRAFRMAYQLVRRSVSCSLASKASSSNTLQLVRPSTHGPQSGPEMPLPSRQAPLP
jgi:hypothetical protein